MATKLKIINCGTQIYYLQKFIEILAKSAKPVTEQALFDHQNATKN